MHKALLTVLLLFMGGQALAVPPGPTPPNFLASGNAIDSLSPFLGTWRGIETIYTANGSYHWNIARKLARPSGVDFIIFEADSNVGPGNPDRFGAMDVIAFNALKSMYNIYLPGYRDMTDGDDTSDLLELKREDNTISWDVPIRVGVRRTTISISDSAWHEKVESISNNGFKAVISDAVLRRASGAHISFTE